MHYVFIMNRFADKKRKTDVDMAISELREKDGADVHVHMTDYAGHAGEIAADYASRYGADAMIIACGGDGTVHEVSNALVFGKTPMAVLPMGTGNDFARSVLPEKYQRNPELVVSRIDRHEIHPADVIRIDSYDRSGMLIPDSSGYSINISSLGLDTLVQAEAKKLTKAARHLRLIRRHAYTIATVICIVRGWDFRLKYNIDLTDGGTSSGETSYCLACICNGQFYGNGFRPSPQARIDDGVLDVSVVEDMPLRKVIPLVPRYKKGTHLPHPKIHTFRATGGVFTAVEGRPPLMGNYEGEDFSGNQVRFKVVPGAVPFAYFPN